MRTDVPQSLSSTVPLFTSPSLCFPVQMFPDPIIPSSYIPWAVPFFPHGVRPMFPSLCVSQSLCFPVPMFSSPSLDIPYKWFTVPMFPKDIPRSLCCPRPFVPQTRSSPELSQVPIFPKMLPSSYVPHKCFHSLCSLKIFPSPYVPQSLCSPVPMSP